MPFRSDAQIWVDLNREYPAEDERAEPEPVKVRLPDPHGRLCFTCKTYPAGTPGFYEYSAYCWRCQLAMLDRLEQDKPVTIPGKQWDKQLARCRNELLMAMRGAQTDAGAGYTAAEGHYLAPEVKPALHALAVPA